MSTEERRRHVFWVENSREDYRRKKTRRQEEYFGERIDEDRSVLTWDSNDYLKCAKNLIEHMNKLLARAVDY